MYVCIYTWVCIAFICKRLRSFRLFALTQGYQKKQKEEAELPQAAEDQQPEAGEQTEEPSV